MSGKNLTLSLITLAGAAVLLLVAGFASAQTTEPNPVADDPSGDGGDADLGAAWIASDTGSEFVLNMRAHSTDIPSVYPARETPYMVTFQHQGTSVTYGVGALLSYGTNNDASTVGGFWDFHLYLNAQDDYCRVAPLDGSYSSGLFEVTVPYNLLDWTGEPGGSWQDSALLGPLGAYDTCQDDYSGGTPAAAGDCLDAFMFRYWPQTAGSADFYYDRNLTAGDESDSPAMNDYELGAMATCGGGGGGGSGGMTVDAHGDYLGVTNSPVTITGTVTGGTAPYTCTWTGTGTPSFAAASSCTGTTVTYATPGLYTLTLTATDAATGSGTDTALINISEPQQAAESTGSYQPESTRPMSGGPSESGTTSDQDRDGIPDHRDNCRAVRNNQNDLDGDGVGDDCDADMDGDLVANGADNCPRVANADQLDTDKDGMGNACSIDTDGDGFSDARDNCPSTSNADQSDLDRDGFGDVCDDDDDGDGVADDKDAFPRDPREHSDLDGDGVGDRADLDDDNDGVTDIAELRLGSDPNKKSDAPDMDRIAQPASVSATSGASAWSWFGIAACLAVLGILLVVVFRRR